MSGDVRTDLHQRLAIPTARTSGAPFTRGRMLANSGDSVKPNVLPAFRAIRLLFGLIAHKFGRLNHCRLLRHHESHHTPQTSPKTNPTRRSNPKFAVHPQNQNLKTPSRRSDASQNPIGAFFYKKPPRTPQKIFIIFFQPTNLYFNQQKQNAEIPRNKAF